MQAQASHSASLAPPHGAEAVRGIAIYEFNQALMGAAQAITNVGYSAGPR